MYLRLFIAFLLSLSSVRADDREDLIKKHAEQIGKLLKDDWKISVSGDTIKLESKFDVWNVGMISRSTSRPKFDPSSQEKFQKEQKSSKYCIFLEYNEAITPDKLMKLLQMRMDYQFALEDCADKESFTEILTKLETLKIPRYRFGTYAIMRSEDRGVFSQVYPEDAVKKIGAAKEVVDGIFMIELPGCLVE